MLRNTTYLNKMRLKFYILKCKYFNGLPLFKKIVWKDEYLSYSFKNINLFEILKFENKDIKKRYHETPYTLFGQWESKELEQYTLGIINDSNIYKYVKEVNVKDIIGESRGQGLSRKFESIEKFLITIDKKTKTFSDYASYFYLFNMTNDQFRDLFINKQIEEYLKNETNIAMNTVYLLEKNEKYYVTINGTHRVLFAKIIGIEKIKAVVFKVDQ
ncbi:MULTISPECIES: hypothetical protein [Staphylococcus]|nr:MULTISPECIES: hypothetical protein [Staphylococcus]KDE94574.1 hypothetical protein CM54_10970 [Staphylococcus sp. TE8]MCY1590915.1 hypothetical protein [Staphylococcus pettenkoferi]MCY1612205.1 hypothetical protein [Staphylococcus pettenkoferi]MDS4062676.1 hypothetical protein [Staphylococcus capitis]